MVFIRPATPGTFFAFAATALLIVASLTTPIIKSLYFLQASAEVNILSQDIGGKLNFGGWGYCVDTSGVPSIAGGDQNECTSVRLGYDLESTTIGQLGSSAIDLPNGLIRTVSYVFIIHPIAAVLSLISFGLGIAAHRSSFARSSATLWVTSIAAVICLAAFIFDMVVTNIARSRVSDEGGEASLGSANWLVLAAFILLFLAACAFGYGRRVVRKRPTKEENDFLRPHIDDKYAASMRDDARNAPWNNTMRTPEGGLPAFAEEEHIPLRAYGGAPNGQEEAISGVGYGEPRFQDSLTGKELPPMPTPMSPAGPSDPNAYHNHPSNVEPFQSMTGRPDPYAYNDRAASMYSNDDLQYDMQADHNYMYAAHSLPSPSYGAAQRKPSDPYMQQQYSSSSMPSRRPLPTVPNQPGSPPMPMYNYHDATPPGTNGNNYTNVMDTPRSENTFYSTEYNPSVPDPVRSPAPLPLPGNRIQPQHQTPYDYSAYDYAQQQNAFAPNQNQPQQLYDAPMSPQYTGHTERPPPSYRTRFHSDDYGYGTAH